MIGIGVILLGSESRIVIFAGIIIAGLTFDAFMAIHQAEVIDAPGLGPYTGTALGFLAMSRDVGGAISPPIGAWMAEINPSMPFYFWGVLGLLAAVAFAFLPSKKRTVPS